MLEILAYRTVAVVHFTDQNWIPKKVYCIKCVMVCKIGFTNSNTKPALLRTPMVVTYYIKLFQTGADWHNGILKSLLLLVAEKWWRICCRVQYQVINSAYQATTGRQRCSVKKRVLKNSAKLHRKTRVFVHSACLLFFSVLIFHFLIVCLFVCFSVIKHFISKNYNIRWCSFFCFSNDFRTI